MTIPGVAITRTWYKKMNYCLNITVFTPMQPGGKTGAVYRHYPAVKIVYVYQ